LLSEHQSYFDSQNGYFQQLDDQVKNLKILQVSPVRRARTNEQLTGPRIFYQRQKILFILFNEVNSSDFGPIRSSLEFQVKPLVHARGFTFFWAKQSRAFCQHPNFAWQNPPETGLWVTPQLLTLKHHGKPPAET
jgi:hypothetical protein